MICQYLILLEKDDLIFWPSKDSRLHTANGNQNPLNRRLYSHAFRSNIAKINESCSELWYYTISNILNKRALPGNVCEISTLISSLTASIIT